MIKEDWLEGGVRGTIVVLNCLDRPLESETSYKVVFLILVAYSLTDGIETVDAGWLTCQTEIRLRLHYSEKPPVVITKKKFKTSRFR